MKSTFLKYTIAGCMLLAVIACKKNNAAVDKDPLSHPEAARILKNTTTESFYIQNNEAGSVYKLPIGITTTSNSDRKVKVTYTSPTGAVNGTQYTAEEFLTIPAGKTLDTLRIKGLFANYPTGRKDTLKIALANADGAVKVNAYSNTFTLVMQKYCEVLLADLGGVFNNTRETNSSGGSPYGPYTSEVEITPIAGSATKANVKFLNFWDSGIEVVGTMDWANPAAFTVTIPRAYTGLDYAAGQPIDVRTSPGQISTFSSCDQSFSLTVDFIVNNYPSPGSSAYYSQNYKIYIRR